MLSLLISAFLVHSTLSMALAERRRELSIARCLGLPAAGLRRLLVLEGAVIGLAGAGGGLLFGRLLARLMSQLFWDTVGSTFDRIEPVVSAPTLGAALDVIERFGWVRAPYCRTPSEQSERHYRIKVEERVPFGEVERIPLLEALLLSLQALIESVRGRPVREARFDLAYPPPVYAARYRDHFHGAVAFDRPETRLTLPAAWLTLPCPMADAAAFASSVAKLEAQAHRLESDDFLPARIEQLLEAAGDPGLPLAAAAKQLRLSRRTLNRRLAGCGTSYRELLEAHLQERARRLLADASLGVGEVAWRLGYEDASNFGRACRRWFGMAPAQLRKTFTTPPSRPRR